MPAMICYRTRRRLGAYVDGALDGGDRRTTESHLAGCARCRDEADQLRKLHAALRRTVPVAPAVPDWTGFWAGIVRGIEDSRHAAPEPAWRGWLRSAWPRSEVWRLQRLAFGGAIAAALVVSLTLWQTLQAPPTPSGAVVVSSARSDAPGASVMVYAPAEKDLAVVWVFDSD
jgi:anti-sigma factor RsiW